MVPLVDLDMIYRPKTVTVTGNFFKIFCKKSISRPNLSRLPTLYPAPSIPDSAPLIPVPPPPPSLRVLHTLQFTSNQTKWTFESKIAPVEAVKYIIYKRAHGLSYLPNTNTNCGDYFALITVLFITIVRLL